MKENYMKERITKLLMFAATLLAITGFPYTPAYADDFGQITVCPEETDEPGPLPVDLSGYLAALEADAFFFTGKEITPYAAVAQGDRLLTPGVDYTVAYAQNVNVGIGYAVITGIGDFYGNIVLPFWIYPKELTAADITLSKTDYVYNGKAKRPAVTIVCGDLTYTKDVDYTVTYSDNTELGTGYVTVTGYGNFTGTVSVPFRIAPRSPAITQTTVTKDSTQLFWNPADHATGYVIYRRESGDPAWTKLKTITNAAKTTYTDNTTLLNVHYEYAIRSYAKTAGGNVVGIYGKSAFCTFQTSTPVINSVLPLSDTSVNVTWGLANGADGYIIYQKNKKSWQMVKTIAATSTNHCVIDQLTYGKEYTFTVQAYWNTRSGMVTSDYDTTGYTEKLSYKSVYTEDGYKLYYDTKGNLLTDVEGIVGPQESYYIRVNRRYNTVTVFAGKKEKNCLVPIKVFLCSTGKATPKGTYKTPAKYRWRPLIHEVYGQWATRITGRILFHSVYYIENENNQSLDVVEFNKLGEPVSAGCVRLTAADTKWIYDHCELKTKVNINSSMVMDPFGIPTVMKLEEWHTWDPTDPTAQQLCAEHGCHQEY